MKDILAQVKVHVLKEGLFGLPREWFLDSTEKSFHKAVLFEPMASEMDAQTELNSLREKSLSCEDCRLCKERRKVVFGTGNSKSPLIAFVGEGPGADEDRQGEPFVGEAGQLLTAAIEKGIGLKRSEVYICNVVKCRPPKNRTPLPDESETCCNLYLYRQLELVNPKVIVSLGATAQLALTGIKSSISKLRGKWLMWRSFKLLPTFHPAYLLRNPNAKREFWLDLQEVMRELNIVRVSSLTNGDKQNVEPKVVNY